jgi:hypothetical protein
VARGVATFTAVVNPSNHRMLQVFRDSGYPLDVRAGPGELHVELPAQLGPEARACFGERAGAAASAARSRATSSPAASTEACAPINPHAHTIAGRRALASVLDVPEPVEMAVVAVAAKRVP